MELQTVFIPDLQQLFRHRGVAGIVNGVPQQCLGSLHIQPVPGTVSRSDALRRFCLAVFQLIGKPLCRRPVFRTVTVAGGQQEHGLGGLQMASPVLLNDCLGRLIAGMHRALP